MTRRKTRAGEVGKDRAVSQRRLLEMQIKLAQDPELTNHSDDCNCCRMRRVSAEVAREILNKKDVQDHELILIWLHEFDRRIKEMPSNN